jgi:hypothetical protein
MSNQTRTGRFAGAMAIAIATKTFLESVKAYRQRPDDEPGIDTDLRIACMEDLEDDLLATVQANLHVFDGLAITVEPAAAIAQAAELERGDA